MEPVVATIPLVEDLEDTIAEVIGTEPGDIAVDENLVMLGLGSLELMRLMTRWRKAGLDLDYTAFVADPTVLAWRGLLTAAWQAAHSDGPAR